MKKSLIIVSVICFSVAGFAQGIRYTKDDTIKYIVKNEIPRFFAGTFWSGVEFPLKNNKSLYISGIATYGSNFNSDRQMIGWGAELQYRSYLGKKDKLTNFPIYMAGHLMFRRLDQYDRLTTATFNSINGMYEDTYSETKQSYNVYYGGILIGCQVFVHQMFTVDVNVGGGIRLSQLDGAKSFTRFKSLTDLDYSGVVPRIGLIIGIIQH
jgi:hypothetical protein